jgi:hypothetical protein
MNNAGTGSPADYILTYRVFDVAPPQAPTVQGFCYDGFCWSDNQLPGSFATRDDCLTACAAEPTARYCDYWENGQECWWDDQCLFLTSDPEWQAFVTNGVSPPHVLLVLR